MREMSFARRRGSGRARGRRDADPIPGPLCLWRYLLGWCAVSLLWLTVVYVKVVVWQQRARYGSALLYLTVAYGFFAWMAENAYVSWKERQGTATAGDHTDPGTKKVLLGIVTVVGGCLTL